MLGLDDELGSLAAGMAGDAAVFEIEEGRYPWQDMDGHEFETEQRLAPQLTVLGIGHEDSDADVKAAYRALVREHHPDRLMAQGMPQEFIDVANKKVAAINEAYHRIRRERNMK